MANQTDTKHCMQLTPVWLELLALDDLAQSIETWTTQMNCTQTEAQVNYGKDYE